MHFLNTSTELILKKTDDAFDSKKRIGNGLPSEAEPFHKWSCTMCGNYCSIKIVNEWLDDASQDVFD